MESINQILLDLSKIKKAMRIDQDPDQDQGSDQGSDYDLDLVKQDLLDQDLDPDLYDLGEAERSLRYYWKNKHRINNPKQYLIKSLAKFMKVQTFGNSKATFKTLGYTDDELDQYLPVYSEDLRKRVSDVNLDIRKRFEAVPELHFVRDKRLVLAAAKKEGLIK